MKIRVNRVQRCCLHDGPGIRTTVFLQGCPLRCWWCHNPETRAAGPAAGTREVETRVLLEELERDADYWKESGGGVTLSGGEPLAQAAAVLELSGALRKNDRHVAIDTCGSGRPDDVRVLNSLEPLWLWDLKAVTPELAAAGTGEDPAQSLANLAWLLDESETSVAVRVPLIAGFNSDRGELERMSEWLLARGRQVPVEILPGHGHGTDVESLRGRRPAPSGEELETALAVFREKGLEVSCAARRRRP